MTSLAERTGSLGKLLYLYIQERDFSTFGRHLQENLIVFLQPFLQIYQGLLLRETLVSNVGDQVDCDEKLALFVDLYERLHLLSIVGI